MSLPYRLIQGESRTLRFELTANSACDAFDLSNYELFFYIKRSLQDSDDAAEFEGTELSVLSDSGITFPYEDTDGVVDVTIPASVTAGLQTGRLYYYYFVIRSIATSEHVYIPNRGQILVMPPQGVEGVFSVVGAPDDFLTPYRITEAGSVRQFEDGELVQFE